LNPAKFKAPYLPPAQIEAEAERVRKEFPSLQKLPVDVLGFAEFDLGLEFDFAPIQQLGQDAFLYPDLSGIWFDKLAFTDPSQQNRLRFSAAHELGHYYLHKDIYGAVSFKSVDEWIAFIGALPASEYSWIESQANIFAGFFLIPSANLSVALDEAIKEAESEGYFNQGREEVLEFCSAAINVDFGVSRQSMQTRIRKSKFWPHPKVAKL
jgi:hypothetical protein